MPAYSQGEINMFWNNIQDSLLKRAYKTTKRGVIYWTKTIGHYAYMLFMLPAIVLVWVMEQLEII
jgi:hypothetical protein|tara:strand:- start:1726 stop:1920 length:195 start_codon:yes stop_codon:yes gene_type:complete